MFNLVERVSCNKVANKIAFHTSSKTFYHPYMCWWCHQNSWTLINVLTTCQLENLKCQKYFNIGSLVETCFTLFTNIVGHSTWRHCWCWEYLANDYQVEKCFQLYTNIVDELTWLIFTIILFKNLKNPRCNILQTCSWKLFG